LALLTFWLWGAGIWERGGESSSRNTSSFFLGILTLAAVSYFEKFERELPFKSGRLFGELV